MTQFQVSKQDLANTRIIGEAETPGAPGDGEILVRVEKFGFSANNVTYGVAGDSLGYWQFFMPEEGAPDDWGIIPVWGFGEVISSNADGIYAGERIFGYLPPAGQFIMRPASIEKDSFFDGAEHRSQLPRGYNLYRRVAAEPGYNPASDDLRMLLFPLYVTGFAIWDQMKEHDWYGAEQVIIISASSKTSIGLAYALEADGEAPSVTGLTSNGNLAFVEGLGIYDNPVSYSAITEQVDKKPAVIVDMAGNSEVLGQLHAHLGDAMMKTLAVGLTHWDNQGRDDRIIRDRREFFFAPAQIQKRIKEWGPEGFNRKSGQFVQEAAMNSGQWLKLDRLGGLEGLQKVYGDVLNGTLPPETGLVIDM